MYAIAPDDTTQRVPISRVTAMSMKANRASVGCSSAVHTSLLLCWWDSAQLIAALDLRVVTAIEKQYHLLASMYRRVHVMISP